MAIVFRRGLTANLPTNAQNGEPLWDTDSLRFYVGNGTATPTEIAKATQPFVTIGNVTGLSGERALTGTANQVVVTDNGANSTVVLSLPQAIATGSSPTFAGLTLSSPLTVPNGGTGLATLTANNVILGNGASTPSFVAPGTSGNVLTSNGTTWASAATSSPVGVSAVGTAQTSVTTTMAASVLTFSPTWGATTKYAFWGCLFFSNANATPDADFQFQGPAVTTLNVGYATYRDGSTSTIAQDTITAFATGGTGGTLVNMNAGIVHRVIFSGSFITTGTPGSNPLRVEFAQNVGDAVNATSLLVGSHLVYSVAV